MIQYELRSSLHKWRAAFALNYMIVTVYFKMGYMYIVIMAIWASLHVLILSTFPHSAHMDHGGSAVLLQHEN